MKKRYIVDIILLAAAGVLIWLDQFTKAMAVKHLADGPFVIWDGVLKLVKHTNSGAVWGILSGKTLFLAIFTIIVLGLDTDRKIVGFFPCTGMHGGKLFLRSRCEDVRFPEQVTARAAAPEDLDEIALYLRDYCGRFGLDERSILDAPFTVVTPDSANPYKQMYVAN